VDKIAKVKKDLRKELLIQIGFMRNILYTMEPPQALLYLDSQLETLDTSIHYLRDLVTATMRIVENGEAL
jgi:hypothetical protein